MTALPVANDEVGEARLHALLAELDRCVTGVGDLLTTQAPATTPAARRAAVAVIDRATASLSTARGRLLLAEKQSQAWQRSGDRSFEAWHGRTSQVGIGAATKEVRRAETLQALPAVAQATDDGAITLEHVDVLAQVAQTAPAAAREALITPEGQAETLALARRTDAATFRKDLARWAASRDLAGHERDHQAQRAQRYLHLSHGSDGTRIQGRLDRITGHRLQLALEAASPRPAPDDHRSPEQRRADALGALAEHALTRPGREQSGTAVRPHVSLVMTEDTWAALRRSSSGTPDGEGTARAGADGGAAAAVDETDGGSGSAVVTGRVDPVGPVDVIGAVAPVVTEDGLAVPLSEVARTLCDCTLTRIVVGADSEPIDLGRTERLYTGAQRRAVIVRDGGCAWPGCGAPARWGEVHHRRWWDRDDGPTSVANGVLLCTFHHHEVHRHDLTIVRVGTHPRAPGNPVAHARYELRRRDGRLLVAHTPADARPPDAYRRGDPLERTARAAHVGAGPDGQPGRRPGAAPDPPAGQPRVGPPDRWGVGGEPAGTPPAPERRGALW